MLIIHYFMFYNETISTPILATNQVQTTNMHDSCILKFTRHYY